MKKYLVCPGIVVAHDGDKHYIGANELMRLYKVSPKECTIIDTPIAAHGLEWSKYLVLRPDATGKYKIPNI